MQDSSDVSSVVMRGTTGLRAHIRGVWRRTFYLVTKLPTPRWLLPGPAVAPDATPAVSEPETGSVAAEAAVLRLEKLVSRMALRIKSSLRRRPGWKQRTWAALSLRAPSCCLRPRRKCLLLALQAEEVFPPVEVLTARHHLREILVHSQTLNLCVKVGAWMTSAPSLMLHPKK